jgi:hypothetical protein
MSDDIVLHPKWQPLLINVRRHCPPSKMATTTNQCQLVVVAILDGGQCRLTLISSEGHLGWKTMLSDIDLKLLILLPL